MGRRPTGSANPDARDASAAAGALGATVDMTPEEFAELLGLAATDAPYLATTTVRLPRIWVDGWRLRTGVLELTVADLAVVLGVTHRTVHRYFADGARPRLSHRVTGQRARAVSPASLVAFLRERSRIAGVVPAIRETAGQRAERGRAAQRRAAELCGDC